MKQLARHSLLLLTAAVLLLGCSSRARLETAVKGANRECPIELGYGFSIQSLRLQGDDCICLFGVDPNSLMAQLGLVDLFSLVPPETVVSAFRTTQGGRDMLQLMKDSDCDMVFCVERNGTEEELLRVPSEEL